MKYVAGFVCLIICLGLLANTACAVSVGSEIQKLENELEKTASLESTSRAKRAYTKILRRTESLLGRSDDRGERFQVLKIVFASQVKLYELKQDEKVGRAIVETARQLTGAPDEMADVRLNADSVLLGIAIDQTDDEHAQALAIAKLADRYRGTIAEVDSLMLCAEASFNIGHRALLEAIRLTMSRKFQDNEQARMFLKERFAFISNETNSEILQQAKKAIDKKQYDKALEIVKQAPSNKVYTHHFVKAQAYSGLKKWDKAMKHVQYFIDAHQSWSKGHLDCCHSLAGALKVRSTIYFKLGMRKESAADKDRYMSIECPTGKRHEKFIQRMADRFLKKLPPLNSQANLEKALKDITGIIVHDGDKKHGRRQHYAPWLRLRGEILQNMGKHKEAQRDLKNADALVKGIEPVKHRRRSHAGKGVATSYVEVVESVK